MANRARAWDGPSDPGDATLRLVASALRAGYANQVAEACRVLITDFRFKDVYVSRSIVSTPASVGEGSLSPVGESSRSQTSEGKDLAASTAAHSDAKVSTKHLFGHLRVVCD